ncbi:MAG: hypothetical protein ABIZ56_06285 [Chthoniobacteraceae bacterium]
MNFRLSICSAAMLVLAGCANVENSGKPSDWPRLVRISTTADLQGNYENNSSGSAGPRLGKLWFYLTRETIPVAAGTRVHLTARDEHHLMASLIEKNGVVLRTRDLASPADFRIKNGVVRLPADFANNAREGFALGAGVGGGTCKLHRAADGSLVGEMYGTAFGIGLFVPATGFGDLWALWKSVP